MNAWLAVLVRLSPAITLLFEKPRLLLVVVGNVPLEPLADGTSPGIRSRFDNTAIAA